MATGIYSWSQTAATNSTADSTINWAEGQAPSTVNDSSRAEMAVLARWRDDISGVQPSNAVQTTAGTATALTLVTNLSIAALTNGWTVAFKSSQTNTGACTLAVDGLAAKPIQRVSGSALIGGEIFAGCVYTATYHQPTDSWVLHNAPSIAAEELLQFGTVAAAATLSIVLTAFTSYRALKFILFGFQPVTDSAEFRCQTSTDGGSNYDAGATDYAWSYNSLLSSGSGTVVNDGDTAGAEINLLTNCANDATHSSNIEVTLWNQTNTTLFKQISWSGTFLDSSDNIVTVTGSGVRLAATDVDAIRFLYSTGNIAAGNFAVVGRRW